MKDYSSVREGVMAGAVRAVKRGVYCKLGDFGLESTPSLAYRLVPSLH